MAAPSDILLVTPHGGQLLLLLALLLVEQPGLQKLHGRCTVGEDTGKEGDMGGDMGTVLLSQTRRKTRGRFCCLDRQQNRPHVFLLAAGQVLQVGGDKRV